MNNDEEKIKVALSLYRYKINIGAIDPEEHAERLEDLLKSAKAIGGISNIERISGSREQRGYTIVFEVRPRREAMNLLQILREQIAEFEEKSGMLRDIIELCREYARKEIPENAKTRYTRYFGDWNPKDKVLAIEVGRDLKTIYKALRRRGITQNEALYSRAGKTRAVISKILLSKYNGVLGPSNIGRILNRNHATVIQGAKRFGRLKLNENDYGNLMHTVDTLLENYNP